MASFNHHGYPFAVDDTWLRDADMLGFVPLEKSYRSGASTRNDATDIFLVALADIEPMVRTLSDGVFNNKGEVKAVDRVKNILVGFRRGDLIPPIELLLLPTGSPLTFAIYDGSHRFYCSIAAGFSHIPAVIVGNKELTVQRPGVPNAE